MNEPDGAAGRPSGNWDEETVDDLERDLLSSSPADVESAGRSCMAILVLAALIFLLLCVWIGLRSTGAGQ
jgi:cobalamin biosynthesis Mg chelatase CobN